MGGFAMIDSKRLAKSARLLEGFYAPIKAI